MILQCSECHARFIVPEHAIGPQGRNVRCARCQHTWFQEPLGGTLKPPENDLDKMLGDINAGKSPEPEKPVLRAIPKGSNLPVVRRKRASRFLKITAGVAALAMILLAVLLTKPELLRMPPSKGLELADVGVTKLMDHKQASFQISGKIYNPTNTPMRTPMLRVTLVDGDGAALQYWDFSGDDKLIDPGQNVPFDTGTLEVRFLRAVHFVVEIGNPLELALRRKPARQDGA